MSNKTGNHKILYEKMKKKQLLKMKNKLEQDRWRKMSLEEIVAELGKSNKHHYSKKYKHLFSSVEIKGTFKGYSRIIYTPMGNKR